MLGHDMSTMRSTNLVGAGQPTPVIIAGFDGHGTTSGVSVSRQAMIPLSQLIIRPPNFKAGDPGTSPEGFANIVNTLNLYKNIVYVLDLAINIKNPNQYLQALKSLADNNQVIIIDHHESNLKYLSDIPQNIRFLQLASATEMLKIMQSMFSLNEENSSIATLGVITDRDSTIKELRLDEREFQHLYSLANVWDFLIRQDTLTAVRNLYEEGLGYIERMATQVQYPPNQLINQIQVVKRENGVILARSENLQAWIWKSLDELLRRNGDDYVVLATKVTDRQLGQEVPATFIVKYWLSDVPSPKPIIIKSIPELAQRKVIGHNDGFSISTVSEAEAQTIAEKIFNVLTSQFSDTAKLFGTNTIANAVDNDFKKILERLEKVLELQTKNYEEYLELKRKQVELLSKSSDSDKRRYD